MKSMLEYGRVRLERSTPRKYLASKQREVRTLSDELFTLQKSLVSSLDLKEPTGLTNFVVNRVRDIACVPLSSPTTRLDPRLSPKPCPCTEREQPEYTLFSATRWPVECVGGARNERSKRFYCTRACRPTKTRRGYSSGSGKWKT